MDQFGGCDFSTNRYSTIVRPPQTPNDTPVRHPDICLNDGNLAILTGNHYFLVHQGLICRHSSVLDIYTRNIDGSQNLEGRPVLHLQDSPEDMAHFLLALYDGISSLVYCETNFVVVSGLLRLSTTYKVHHLRSEIIRGLSEFWPLSLYQWDKRESPATDSDGVYLPSQSLPHPILVINLAHEIDAPELLPSAFYDLSRAPASDTAVGHTCPNGSSGQNSTHTLSPKDLLNLLRGQEHTSRYLSTFIVNELEGREPSRFCFHRQERDIARRRACQVAFESTTFELLRDINGVQCNRNSDPLNVILLAEMQTRDQLSGVDNQASCYACECCRSEFCAVVEASREEFWARLPVWFGQDSHNWG